MSYTIETKNLSPIELAEYLETATFGTEIEAFRASDNEKIIITNCDNDKWNIDMGDGGKFLSTLAICMLNENCDIEIADCIDLTHNCIHIGYVNNTNKTLLTSHSYDTVWPIVNPWREGITPQGKQFTPISENEFSREFLKVLNDRDDDIFNSVAILNIHSSVNATQVMWSIKALKSIGIKNIEIRSAENGSMRYKIR